MNVWTIEHGEYEERETLGVAATLEAAVAFIKGIERAPGASAKWSEVEKLESYEDTWVLRCKVSGTREDGSTWWYRDEYDITEVEVIE